MAEARRESVFDRLTPGDRAAIEASVADASRWPLTEDAIDLLRRLGCPAPRSGSVVRRLACPDCGHTAVGVDRPARCPRCRADLTGAAA